ncbi:MAG TPA: methionyl-tRNA formyltransferase [Tepidisphaeraceae bacterium]|nr:methionyl-tRNA formyltransferase [Tepidisphaeraceae bacterium]
MNMLGLNVIFAGSGEFGLPTLRALLASGHRILTVVSQPDRPAGRGKVLTPTPIAQFAIDQHLPLIRTGNINAETLPPADVMVVIAFGQKIAPAQVDHPRLGSVNLHASLLPKYRGAAPINWAILRGETVSGNSVIRLVQRMDAGAILGQSELPIEPLETAGELHDRLADAGAPLMLDVLRQLAEGTLQEKPQNESLATLAPKLNREVTHIDWSHPAREIAWQIRGLFPWPGCRVRIIDATGKERSRLTLVRARPAEATAAAPGSVVNAAGHVAAGDRQAIEIVEVQPEGKRPMSLAAYRNGHPWEIGMRLESL